MPDLSAPAESAVAVAKSDTVGFAKTRGLFVGVAGVVVAVMADARVVTFTGVQNGQILPIQITRVNSTNTTATDMVALY